MGWCLLFGGGRGSYPRLGLGISYMYWWRAWYSGRLVVRVGGTLWAWGPMAIYGREGW